MADIESDDGALLELALFAGGGGGILGGRLLGWRTVCAVEINPFAASILCSRQNDGTLEPFPIWGDIRSFRSRNRDCRQVFAFLRSVRHRLVISGGFPCQDISVAGGGAGLDGERSGLWSEQARIIREIRPRYVWVENSPALTGRGLHRVLGDLATLGFDARWGVLSAEDAIWSQGTPAVYHGRERIWIYGETTDIDRTGFREQRTAIATREKHPSIECCGWWATEPGMGRVAHGVANRVDRLAALGNGQVPAVVELAWKVLSRGEA